MSDSTHPNQAHSKNPQHRVKSQMIVQGLAAFRDKRVLLLQGPVGPFFRRLAKDLTWAGAQVFKVNFNGGDCLFYSRDAITFRGPMDQWPTFFEEILVRLNIEAVMLFGDCRPIHRVAHDIAHRHGLEIGVFEEGYVRPNYITLERHGVNAHSLIPRSPIFYLNNPIPRVESPRLIGNTFLQSALCSMAYYLAGSLASPWFRNYQHHRPLNLREIAPWLRSFWRKGFYAIKEAGLQAKLTTKLSKKFFLVPLQVHCDSQIREHSDFGTVEAFITHVVESFAAHAPRDTWLIFKHHPMDRGYHDYTDLIDRLASASGVGRRLRYVHDLHLPSLLQHTRGVVVINSTVGLSAMYHNAPVKVCGRAIYDIKGLTYEGTLNAFWRAAKTLVMDRKLYRYFYDYLINNTQINGSFYKLLSMPGSFTGLRWQNSGVRSGKRISPAAAERKIARKQFVASARRRLSSALRGPRKSKPKEKL